MIYALVVFGIVQAADVITTSIALHAGKKEKNPIIRWFMNEVGPAWIPIKLAISCAGAYLIYTTGLAWPLWVLNVLIGAVAFNNARIVWRDKV